jgi:hypothetical protein
MKTKSALVRRGASVACAVMAALIPSTVSHADGPGGLKFIGPVSVSMPLIGGPAAPFGLASSACVGADFDDLLPSGFCNLTASGTYYNTICGSGMFIGQATISPDPSEGGSEVWDFRMEFMAGVGIMVGVAGDAVGVATLVPTSPQPQPGCTQGVELTASVVWL